MLSESVIELLKLLSIPVIAGLVGLMTNWLAIKLTFYPINFWGIKPFLGWQGIIPSKARKMAEISVDSTLSRLGSISEIIEQMNPTIIGEHILSTLEPRLEELVDEIMRKRHRTLWQNLPKPVKQIAYTRVKEELPSVVDNLVADIAPKIESLFDLKAMVINHLEQDKTLLNKIFLECGEKEFSFIIKSGLWFGFLFGLPQLLLWYFFPSPLLLPICGFLVGWATNWLALNMIFRPVAPIKFMGLTIHGLFLKRQPEVSDSFCTIVTEEILTVDLIVQAMLSGKQAPRTRAIIQRHFEDLVDEVIGVIKPLTQAAMGLKSFADLKQDTGQKAIDLSAQTLQDPLFNHQRAQLVKEIMSERMKQLPSEEFQDLLRPCFQEDEIKLIIIGGILGALAGIGQIAFIFGQSLLNL
tara:strand:- start:21013 stop:22245 length:1233 start_codon:yes stop_codon:yes gene_type:complete